MSYPVQKIILCKCLLFRIYFFSEIWIRLCSQLFLRRVKSGSKILKNSVQNVRPQNQSRPKIRSRLCTVLGVQWVLVQKAAGTRSVWPSTVSEAECNHYWRVQYSFCHKDPFFSASSKLLPIISHPGEGLVAEPSSLSSSAAYLLNNPCRRGLKTQHDNLNMT